MIIIIGNVTLSFLSVELCTPVFCKGARHVIGSIHKSVVRLTSILYYKVHTLSCNQVEHDLCSVFAKSNNQSAEGTEMTYCFRNV